MLLCQVAGWRLRAMHCVAVIFFLSACLMEGSSAFGPATTGPPLTKEQKCAVCETAVLEMHLDMREIDEGATVDLRNRLDPHGKRQGKEIPYHQSELKAVEMLEKVCSHLKDYSISNDEGPSKLVRHNARKEGDPVTLSNVSVDSGVSDRMNAYCGTLVGNYEDEITEMIMAGKDARTMFKSFCIKQSKVCKGQKREDAFAELYTEADSNEVKSDL